MTEMNERTVWTIDILLLISSTLVFYSALYILTEDRRKEIGKTVEKEYIERPVPEEPVWEAVELQAVNEYYELKNAWQDIEITYQTIELHYLGKYFVTAYCPEECGGSWKTSSGATCHYSTDNRVPTTCAIDRSIHGYNEIISIDGKLYITEDTGPGVKGAWVDCFVETMEEVRAWDTGYKSVYSVSYENHLVQGNERKVRHELIKHSLLFGNVISRSDHRLGN